MKKSRIKSTMVSEQRHGQHWLMRVVVGLITPLFVFFSVILCMPIIASAHGKVDVSFTGVGLSASFATAILPDKIPIGQTFIPNANDLVGLDLKFQTGQQQGERDQYLEAFEARDEHDGWHEVIREVSPTNPCQKKGKVWIKECGTEDEVHLLCVSEGRMEKDRAIRETQESRFLADVTKLKTRIANGRLVKPEKINQAIGRLKERYPRVSRYYELCYHPQTQALTSEEKPDKKEQATTLDGGVPHEN